MTTWTGLSADWRRLDTPVLLRRTLRAGFWFFMVKGLLWLALPLVLREVLVG